MRSWIHRLASLKISVILLVVILVALSAGTIIESMRGTEAAGSAVYYAPWFEILLALFALNVACSIVDHWPWGLQRTGFALTHGSLLVILAGALVTAGLKVEGRLAVWEGEKTSRFAETSVPGGDGAPRTIDLPFSIRLESFEIDTYPGTMRPAMFRSRVVVEDPANGVTLPAVIEMNRELRYGGYRFFQSSYQQTETRDQSILLVSRDPGQWIVFTGYTLLLAGMLTVLATRISQRLRASNHVQAARVGRARHVAAAGVGLVSFWFLGTAGPARAATMPDPQSAARLAGLPVQHDGRVMPLDTLAREAARKVTGKEEWNGAGPVSLVLGWTLRPEEWADEPIVKLGKPELNTAIGFRPDRRYASFNELVGSRTLMDLMRQEHAALDAERPLPPLLGQVQKLEERLVWMQGFLQERSILVYPVPEDPGARWAPPEHVHETAGLIDILERAPAAGVADRALIDREITYNHVRPTRLSWWILLGATAVSLLAWNRGSRWLEILAWTGLGAGFLVMSWGIAVRWQIAGRIPASNMYESLLFLGWGVAAFALIAVVFMRHRLLIFNATAMAALTMILADCLPIDPFIHPIPPVLSGTAWLAIHVPIIMLSYSVLALGVIMAHLQIGFEIFAPRRRDLVLKMNDLLYWYLHIGSILLIAGILTGSIWAASSWGRYWGWDPKEVWSLVAFLAYLAILHGRLEKILGPFGVAAASIVAFWTIIMTYVGVNFVLASGLHSYGFGGSGVVRWLAGIAAVEVLFLSAGAFASLAGGRGRGTGARGAGPLPA